VDAVKHYLEEQRRHYAIPMDALLAELKSATGLEMKFHPGYTPGLRRAGSLHVGYKLHERGSDRILILLIHEFEYIANSSGNWSFRSDTAEEIRFEILNFWNGETTDPVGKKYIPAQQ